MTKFLMTRVIMLPDGSAHIAMFNRQTIECTPKSLSDLLSDPHEFIEEKQFQYNLTGKRVNPQDAPLSNIKGLTLLKIYSDAEVVCIFPKLFDLLFKSIQQNKEESLNLKEYVSSLDFSDEKHFLLKFFYEFTNEPRSGITISRKMDLDFEVQSEIMRETFNTTFLSAWQGKELKEPEAKTEESTEDLFPSKRDDSDNITIKEYAQMHGVKETTVYTWIRKKKISGYTKINNRTFLINKNTPVPLDGRAGRNMPKRGESGIRKYTCKGNDYQSVQEYIKDNRIVSDAVRPFIRTYEEIKYYEKHRYHEVSWDGRNALIIDVNLDYFSEKHQMTNRELIQREKAPVVPGKEDFEFVIHHVGQLPNSPFAIIPEDDHSHFHGLFHTNASPGQTKNGTDELHNANFEFPKKAFWQKYLKEYDRTGNFANIPYTNLKHKKDK